ncbi:PadR family transcriptional regulator AphA [Planotetraspora sp. GP83]
MSRVSYSEGMSLRIALLGLLTASGPASGYDLAKTFETSVAHVWQAGHSQIYPELAKMAADGLVAVEAEGPRGRKIYTITAEGSQELRRWMLDHSPSATYRSEESLQAFLMPLLDPREAIELLQRMKVHYETKLAQMEELRRNHPAMRRKGEGWGHFGVYALDLGIRRVRATLEWAVDSIADIERRL